MRIESTGRYQLLQPIRGLLVALVTINDFADRVLQLLAVTAKLNHGASGSAGRLFSSFFFVLLVIASNAR